jgi:hypothetical protein
MEIILTTVAGTQIEQDGILRFNATHPIEEMA